MKSKYAYAIVTKAGNLYVLDSMVPIYWTKKVATSRIKLFQLKNCLVKRIEMEKLLKNLK